MIRFYDITLVPKPRMTRRDKFLRGQAVRPAVGRYRAFKDECRLKRVTLDMDRYYHVLALMPVPLSCTDEERQARIFQPHRFTPDKDNLEKALLDALFGNDAGAWDGRMTKVWAGMGGMFIADEDMDVTPLGLRSLVRGLDISHSLRSTLMHY